MINLYSCFMSTKNVFTSVKLYVCLVILFSSLFTAKAQYTFTAASGTFTPLSGGTVVTALHTDDNLSGFINLGFNFKFNGKVYTQAKVSSNGFISFKVNPVNSGFRQIDSVFIAPLGDDLGGAGGTASYKIEGTAPNRVFTMEWLNFKWRYIAAQAGISFQVKLYETSNRIEFIYRQEAGAVEGPYAFIGLSFQKPGKYLYLTNSGSSPSITTSVPGSISTKPATGQIYRFDPNILPEPSGHVTAFSSLVNGSVSVKWTDATGENLPSRYLIKVSNVSFEAITDPVDGQEPLVDLDLSDGTGLVYCDFGSQMFKGWTDSTGSTTYYMKIYPISNPYTYSDYKTDGSVPQLQITTPAYESRLLELKGATSSTVNLQWIKGSYAKRVVFAKENGTGKAVPINNTTYTANSAYGSGTQIGSTGWYCVYNGTGNTVNITGLLPDTKYAFHVIEYNGAAGAENYSTTDSPTANKIFSTSLFADNTTLTGIKDGAVAWVDYDNDNDLDCMVTGAIASGRKTILYRNDAGSFVNSGVVFPDVNNSSVAWGDYDNDGFADVIIMGLTSTNRITSIYHNNGNGTFTILADTNFPGLSMGSASWGDYNNDGLIDLFMCGFDGTNYTSKIYRNDGLGKFSAQPIAIVGVRQASAVWADFDNDGYIDLVVSGYNGSQCLSRLYKNNRLGDLTQVNGFELPYIANSSLDVGDYDSDGDLDILFSGNYYVSDCITQIYNNQGNFVFIHQANISFVAVRNGSPRFGDMDNDGDLDVVVTGLDNDETGATKVYTNNNGLFEESKSIVLPNVGYSSMAWGDYDNDNDLDILLAGETTTGLITKIFKNETHADNILPPAPNGLVSTVNKEVLLRWNKVIDNETPTDALTYNVRIGKTTGANDVVSSLSSATGLKRIPAMGNAMENATFKIKILKKGTYYWSVQAVDNTFAGGAFAAEQTFSVTEDYQASDIAFTSFGSDFIKLKWQRGNGDKCLVFVKENGTGTALPVNNTTYTGNKTFGSGTQIGTTGWYCVYNGDQDTATITNLKPTTRYIFQVFEYTGTAGAEVFYTGTGAVNPAVYVPAFTEEIQIPLTGVSGHTNAWGDYDNDGDLDLALCGYTGSDNAAELYQNNGNNTFTKTPVTFASHTYYDFQWGDYDNDNDLDLLALTDTDSKVYENNGDGTFTPGTALPIMSGGKGVWTDFDNDGYKDIIVLNSMEMKVLKNNRDKTFTFQSNSMPGLSDGSVACGDYDNDGDQDVLLAGREGSAAVTKVFRNDGDFAFTEQTGITLPGISNCTVAWADMDIDGNLDIVLSGADNDFYTKIYNNNGNNTFSLATTAVFKELYRTALAIGDYDNDGYRDLIVSGSYDGDDYYTILYRNNRNNTYSEVKTIGFPGIQFGSLNWGDYDNDNDLDLFVCGATASGRIAKIFKNNTSVSNTKPYTPSISSITLEGSDVNIKWYRTSDDETGSYGTSYNIYVYEGSKPGFNLSGEAFTREHTLNGYRKVASFGNIQSGALGYTLKGLPAGDYKCSIQAVDAGMMGGNFTYEASFSIYDLTLVGIDVAESQITGTKAGMEYSFDSTDGVDGTWNSCTSDNTFVNFPGGIDVWVRQHDNITNKRKVAVIPAEADAPTPTFTINYLAEATTENIPETIEAYTHSSMTGVAINGNGNPMALRPGLSYYFRTKATASTVASKVQTLVVPDRPSRPTISIDYAAEKTTPVIPTTIEYASAIEMSNPTLGTGEALQVTPGQALYFRVKATTSSFCSDIYTLSAPARPFGPIFNIDYINEVTESMSSDYEYSDQSDMANAVTGDGSKVPVTPGKNLNIRKKATSTSFSSIVRTLEVPARPEAPSSIMVNDVANTLDWNFNPNYSYITDYEYSLDGGSTWTSCTTKPISVGNVNIAAGDAKIRTRALTSRFKGAEASSTSAFTFSTDVASLEDAGIRIFPVPVNDILFVENLPENSFITIFNLSGKLVYQLQTEDLNIKIPVMDIPQGMYLIKVKTPDGEFQSKFSKQ